MPLLSDPVYRRIAGTSQLYELMEDLVYQGARDRFVIKTGFRTDLASIPKGVQWLLPHDGPYAPAAILHDWCYVTRPMVTDRSGKLHFMTRLEADGLMDRVMRELGVSWWKRQLIYAGVRSGGWWYWYKCGQAIGI